jgi:LuxR family maltose regulon positive regulatory protein
LRKLNKLHAANLWRHFFPLLQRIDEYSPPNAPLAYLGLARICYEWNDLDAAGQYGEQSLHLARQYDRVIDRLIVSELFLAQLKLARRDAIGAALILSQTEQTARQKNHTVRLPDIAYAQAMIHLHQGNVDVSINFPQHFPSITKYLSENKGQVRILSVGGGCADTENWFFF